MDLQNLDYVSIKTEPGSQEEFPNEKPHPELEIDLLDVKEECLHYTKSNPTDTQRYKMTEKLIELVRCKPFMYDTRHPDYSKKSLKEVLWARIATEANYKDGSSAKDAWMKLRNCHRDAIRRRDKLYKNGAAASTCKRWKFEQQMEFLETHMTNRSTSGNISSADDSTQERSIQLEDAAGTEEMEEIEIEIEKEVVNFTSASASPNEPARKESKTDVNALIAQTIKNHEERAQQRAAKRSSSNDQEKDDLHQFFNTMYLMTKKMPEISQIKMKRKIFNLVLEEEEYLLHEKQNNKERASLKPIPDTPGWQDDYKSDC